MKWIALLFSLLLPFSALADALPMSLMPAPAPDESGYISETEYQDDTLSVRISQVERDNSVYTVAYVTIADPSQLRTALAGEIGSKAKALPSQIAKGNGAVVAINGDFYLNQKKGVVIRMGEVIRQKHQSALDLLLIDTAGDFHIIRKPSKQATNVVLEEYTILNAFTFGPALVIDGELQKIRITYGYAPQDKAPRTAIGQLGPLSYALVVVDGRQKGYSRGVTHKMLGEFMLSIGCTQAYNLDGGGTTTMIFHDRVVNRPSGGDERDVSDIIYFASAL